MFVIYDLDTGRIARKNCADMAYPTERGARNSCSRMNKQDAKDRNSRYIVMSREQYEFYYNPMVETTNILTGKKCIIRKSELGGCCDPGTARYHCM